MRAWWLPQQIGQQQSGFTLLELILATVIASLVLGIMGVSLTFTLRLWEKNRYQVPNNGPQLLRLLEWQLGSFYPFPVTVEKRQQLLFFGDHRSLVFATGFSVRALTKGAPVVARYVYDEEANKIFYAEIPFDPYHSEELKKFLDADPEEGNGETWPRFYGVDVADFKFSYLASQEERYSAEWEAEGLPSEVRVQVKWKNESPEQVWSVIPNFFLPGEIIVNETQ